MSRCLSKAPLPDDLQAFAAASTGEFEQRFEHLVEHAFMTHGLLLNAAQLRKLCAGGSQETAQRAINRFRESLHQRVNRRLSASAIAHWIEQGMRQEMPELSPKEKLVAQVFLRQVAQASRPRGVLCP